MVMKHLIFVIIALLTLSLSSFSAELQEAIDNYEAGNYGLSFHQFSVLAGEGNPNGQYYLAKHYYYGRGVSQNYSQAAAAG